MASSSPSSLQAKRYDVFISSRGEVKHRYNFVHRIHGALFKKQILTFIDDKFSKNDEISFPSLKAIEESTISVIILSKTYAGSKLCLMELERIMECKKSNGQIVIPVFYRVDPLDVRHQTGEFGAAFAKLEERLKEEETMDLTKIRSNLNEAGSISGFSSNNRVDADLIMSIVAYILHLLSKVRLDHPVSLVGIASHVEQVETQLRLDWPAFRSVGICGPGGIGKTTIAKVVLDHIGAIFDGNYFVEKVSKQSMDEIVLQILKGESLNASASHLIRDQLKYKRFLIVLDDIDDQSQAQDLVDTLRHLLFGGSRVLLTCRNKQGLENVVDGIYEVEGLGSDDAHQLFNLNAFKLNQPPTDREHLAETVCYHVGGNPLAIVVLGCALFGRSREVWHRVLDGLVEARNSGAAPSVLRIGYDTLNDDEKEIFLDIARYLIGMDLEALVRCYGRVVLLKLRQLIDKSLITMPSNKIEMHDSLREMACSIDRENKQRVISTCSPQIPPKAKVGLNWIFPLTNLVLEILLLTLDQLASAQKPFYGLIAVVVALSSVVVCLGELVFKGWNRNVTLKWQGMRCRIQYPQSEDRPFFTWLDVFSLACAIAQLVFSSVGYSYLQQHKKNPITVSIVSIIYIICLIVSKVFHNPIEEGLPIRQKML